MTTEHYDKGIQATHKNKSVISGCVINTLTELSNPLCEKCNHLFCRTDIAIMICLSLWFLLSIFSSFADLVFIGPMLADWGFLSVCLSLTDSLVSMKNTSDYDWMMRLEFKTFCWHCHQLCFDKLCRFHQCRFFTGLCSYCYNIETKSITFQDCDLCSERPWCALSTQVCA